MTALKDWTFAKQAAPPGMTPEEGAKYEAGIDIGAAKNFIDSIRGDSKSLAYLLKTCADKTLKPAGLDADAKMLLDNAKEAENIVKAVQKMKFPRWAK